MSFKISLLMCTRFKTFSLLLLSSFFFSCKEEKKITTDDKASRALELMSFERSFSRTSESVGMKNAFIDYLDSNGVLLRPNQFPIVGANAIDYLIQQNDDAYTLTWDPQHAYVSDSGDLGYTYGVYIMKPVSKDTLFYGTYTHIWKRQNDGKWKLVLNTSNEGVQESDSID